jgi:hypothetical protein
MHAVQFNLDSLKGERLGGGCYSTVYRLSESSEWVLKVGRNDGTRTYLEWCKRRQDAGKSLRGMPKVDWVASIGEKEYAACIEAMAHDPARDGTYWDKYGIQANQYSFHASPGLPEYVGKLIRAMKDECGVYGNDLHHANFLINRKGDVVLTDPDSDTYRAAPPVTLPDSQEELFPAIQFE